MQFCEHLFCAHPLDSNFGVILPSTVIGRAEFSFHNQQFCIMWPTYIKVHSESFRVNIIDQLSLSFPHSLSFLCVEGWDCFGGFVRQKLMYSLWGVGWDKKFVHTFSVSICWWSFAFRLTIILIIVIVIDKLINRSIELKKKTCKYILQNYTEPFIHGAAKKTEHCQLCTLWSPPKISFLATYSKY